MSSRKKKKVRKDYENDDLKNNSNYAKKARWLMSDKLNPKRLWGWMVGDTNPKPTSDRDTSLINKPWGA